EGLTSGAVLLPHFLSCAGYVKVVQHRIDCMRKSLANPLTTRSLLGAALLALVCSAGTALPARAAEPVDAAPWHAELVKQAQAEFSSFYAYRSGPLWIAHGGSPNAAAGALLDLIRTAHFDGLDPALLGYSELAAAIGALERDASPAARARAELALSRTFVTYVRSLRDTADNGMLYEHDLLRPYEPEAYTALENAAGAPSLE